VSAGFLRLVVEAAYDEGASNRTQAPQQLSLFDFRPCRTVLCFPMAEMHGNAFRRVFLHHRPKTVVDTRSHPYFDLNALGRQAAYALFASTPAEYRRLPVDLRRTETQAERWRSFGEAARLLRELACSEPEDGTVALLVNRHQEISIIEGATAQAETARAAWQVVTA
jgi:hypothetical protein